MANDPYSKVWVSHTSINNFLKCPRAYWLLHIWKNPITGNRIQIINPALALGQVVHDVLEDLSNLPSEERLKDSILADFENQWKKVYGKLGGFKTEEEEVGYKARGEAMIKRVMENPGPILNKALKIPVRDNFDLPHYDFSAKDGVVLCGKIDWLEYLPETDSVHILDFKTGKNDEEKDSLQLPIYILLVKNCQSRAVTRVSYWYLDRDNKPAEVELPNLDEASERILAAAKKIKLARSLGSFKCPKGGCFNCRPLERIYAGEGEKVGVSSMRQDIFVLD